MSMNVYGYVNGQPAYSRDEYVYNARHFGPIEDDDDLIAYAEKVTGGWQYACQRHSFETFYLSDYALSEPCRSLTDKEFDRLKELQRQARENAKAADDARCWRSIGTYSYADNSIEEVFEDKDGTRKTVMKVYPHGDAC